MYVFCHWSIEVIESLNQKNEENWELVEEVSEEEIDGIGEASDEVGVVQQM